MSISIALLSPPIPPFFSKSPHSHPFKSLPGTFRSSPPLFRASADPTAPVIQPNPHSREENGAAFAEEEEGEAKIAKFQDPKWINGTWDLARFYTDGKIDWDAVVDAEVKRRKWLENIPEASSNEDPVRFETSMIPWWVWMKRFHLPEAELLNGRAAMIGFFMGYLVDALTGVGLVDQMDNFVCKTLLFVVIVGVLVVRKNEDVRTVKKLIREITFYDKQWQATWLDDKPSETTKE